MYGLKGGRVRGLDLLVATLRRGGLPLLNAQRVFAAVWHTCPRSRNALKSGILRPMFNSAALQLESVREGKGQGERFGDHLRAMAACWRAQSNDMLH